MSECEGIYVSSALLFFMLLFLESMETNKRCACITILIHQDDSFKQVGIGIEVKVALKPYQSGGCDTRVERRGLGVGAMSCLGGADCVGLGVEEVSNSRGGKVG